MKGLIFILLLLPSLVIAEESEFAPINDSFYLEHHTPNWRDLIKVHDVSYIRNKKASFCTRPVEMIDTIVIHHSETRNTDTPIRLNEYHLNRGSSSDPWYMIAYSYVINAPYSGQDHPLPKVSVGRPLQIVGAHAGSRVFVPMDDVQKRLWAQRKILCGKENEIPKFDPMMVKNGKIKANVTTIGMVAVGNYAEFSGQYVRHPRSGRVRKNPNPNLNGFSPAKQPTADLVDMYARLSCQLQRKYPRITKLTNHNMYLSTSCPGTIQEMNNMKAIQAKAKEYGCEFKLPSSP